MTAIHQLSQPQSSNPEVSNNQHPETENLNQAARLTHAQADLKTASSGNIDLKNQTQADAIEAFKADTFDQYNLYAHSPMPVDLLLAPLKQYSAAEISSFNNDFHKLKLEIDAAAADGKLDQTAGAPFAGKSTLFKAIAALHKSAYLDFDTVALPGLSLFKQAIQEKKMTPEEAYHYYRGASHVIHNTLLAYAISKHKNIALAITSTSFYESGMAFFTEKNYNIDLHHITCPVEVRQASKKIRDEEAFFQCSDEDFHTKATAFFDKTNVYLQRPNIHFWYRSEANSAAQLAAVKHNGQLQPPKDNEQAKLLSQLVRTHQQEHEKSGQILKDFLIGKTLGH